MIVLTGGAHINGTQASFTFSHPVGVVLVGDPDNKLWAFNSDQHNWHQVDEIYQNGVNSVRGVFDPPPGAIWTKVKITGIPQTCTGYGLGWVTPGEVDFG